MTEFDTLIAGASVVTPHGQHQADVAIRGERIAALLEPGSDLDAAVTVDGRRRLLLPGAIDPHVHFENPSWGTATAHDFQIGTEAAALGGTTAIVDFAFQVPGESPMEALGRRRALADPKVVVDYGLHGTITDANLESVEEVRTAVEAGYPTIKVFMAYGAAGWMMPDDLLRLTLRQVAEADGMLMVHAENDAIIEQARSACVERGDLGPGAHARSRPAVAEEEAIRRVLTFAAEVDCAVYVVHLSTAAGLAAIEEARARGVRVWTETCPHYLVFDDSVLDEPGGERYVMSPPLRKPSDREALWEGLRDGRIDALGSDDAAYTLSDKERDREDFREIPNGVPGAQMRTHVVFDAVARGEMSASRFVDLACAMPAKLFGFWPEKGQIAPGADADLALWDPALVWAAELPHIHTNIGHTCYEGRSFRGRPVQVWSRGRLVVEDGALRSRPGAGMFVARGRLASNRRSA